jgi:peptide/nickel transport system permease protein
MSDAGSLVARRGAFRGLGLAGALAVAVLIVDGVFVVLGGFLAPHSPTAVDLYNTYGGSSSAHWLGQDSTGRDILSRIMVGARPSLVGPAAIVMCASVVGIAAGIAAAWLGGWFDTIVSRTVDVLFAFPGLLLAILAVAMFGPGLTAPVIALAIAYTPGMARVTRSAALRERSLPYVDALAAQGLSGTRICTRHILPNLSRFLAAQITVSFGYAIVDLAAVSFLGLGVQPPNADWGLMVANGSVDILRSHPETALYAGAMIVITVVALNVLGGRVAGEADNP